MLREATPGELSRWDELIASNPDGGNVLQARAFGELKSRYGWKDKYFLVGRVAVLVLTRKCPFKLGDLWYIPRGPGFTDINQIKQIALEAGKRGAFVLKTDPELLAAQVGDLELSSMGLIKTRDIQYNVSTVIVDLNPSEEEILASFKQKTRYNIRLAERKGVKVRPVEVTDEYINQMYDMAKATYERAGVYVRSKQYFSDFWKLHADNGVGQMFFAEFNGKLVAGAFITYLGKKALYKDGASYREHSSLQAPYLLQWEIIRWLKAKEVSEYDLHGVPPPDQLDNPKHPLAGLARFKTGFSDEVVEYIGTYDYACHKASYAVWRAFGERFAMAYESRVKKRLFY